MQNGKSGPPHLGTYVATPPVEKRMVYPTSGCKCHGSDGSAPAVAPWTLGHMQVSVKRPS